MYMIKDYYIPLLILLESKVDKVRSVFIRSRLTLLKDRIMKHLIVWNQRFMCLYISQYLFYQNQDSKIKSN